MKRLLTFLLSITILCSFGQDKEQTINSLTDQVCNCISNLSEEKLAANAMQEVGICVQQAINKDLDKIIEVYGEGVIEDASVGKQIGLDITQKLTTNCDAYRDYINSVQANTKIEDFEYTEEQWATIGEIAVMACSCSEEKFRAEPNADMQQTLELCMQEAAMKKMEVLLEVFGNEFLSDQTIAYNMGVEVGKILAVDCGVYNGGGSVASSFEVAIGTLSAFSTKGDFLTLTLKNDDGEKDYMVITPFEELNGLVEELKTLKKEGRTLTIYYSEFEVYLKSENISKSVFKIESVKY